MHLLAYNLIRTLMAQAAELAGVEPREVSFAGAVQTVNAFAPMLELADPEDLPRLLEILLRIIARHRVGDRPNRYEPRAVKRRAKPIALLTIPEGKHKCDWQSLGWQSVRASGSAIRDIHHKKRWMSRMGRSEVATDYRCISYGPSSGQCPRRDPALHPSSVRWDRCATLQCFIINLV